MAGKFDYAQCNKRDAVMPLKHGAMPPTSKGNTGKASSKSPAKHKKTMGKGGY